MKEDKDSRNIILDKSWLNILKSEFSKSYMKRLSSFLRAEKRKGKVIYPAGRDMFLSLNETPFNKVKVVILGQDPYPGPGQAHGLSFSVLPGVSIPASLKNIFNEINTDLSLPIPKHGHLLKWSLQGVLLLNSVLSVERGLPGSHAGKGWENFTDIIIKKVSEKGKIVFILWGNYARNKVKNINNKNNLILESAHPSPLSANKGFFGNKHFSNCNEYLRLNGIEPINWTL